MRLLSTNRCFFLCVTSFIVVSSACAEEEVLQKNQDLQLESGGVLEYFCDCGLLIDRGLTNTLFAGSADDWIVHYLMDDDYFCRRLGFTPQQRKCLLRISDQNTVRTDVELPKHRTAFDTSESISTRNGFRACLTEEQMKKLLAVYLDLEGLMALRREEFHDVLELDEKVIRSIILVTNQTNEEEAIPLHRELFTLPNRRDARVPAINLELRQVSSRLDRRLLALLSAKHRQRLKPLVESALSISDVVRGPGIGRPWFIDPSIRQKR